MPRAPALPIPDARAKLPASVNSPLMRAFALALAVVAPLGAGCRRRPDRCVPTCEQRNKQLGCHPAESCQKTCETLHAPGPCRKELGAWEDCVVALPPKYWECDDNGQPVPLPGACPKERDGVETCMAKQPQPPVRQAPITAPLTIPPPPPEKAR